MKYFRYNLNENNEGPASVLPVDSITGIFVNNHYYGSSSIDSLDILIDWNAVEISKNDYDKITIPVPQSITRRQCAIELRERSIISSQEALNMTKYGDVPSLVQQLLSQMNDADRIKAETDFAANTYMRSNPLLISVMTEAGSTEEEIDQFFRDASKR